MGLRDAGHKVANVLPGAAAAVSARLPLGVAESLGARTGVLFGTLPHRFHRRLIENLARAFPEQTRRQRSALARRTMAHVGREGGATLKWFARPDARIELPRICRNFSELAATIERDLAGGHGAIYAGAHLGNPQLLSALCATVAAVTGVGTDYHNREHLSFVGAGRRRLGLHYVAENSPPLDLLRALQRNELVTFLPDVQPRRSSGLWLSFFGQPACTTTFPAALSRLTGCVLRPVFLVREGEFYRALIHDAFEIPRAAEGEAGLARVMQAWSALLETEIRRHPEQWIWMSRRWRSMPAGAQVLAAQDS